MHKRHGGDSDTEMVGKRVQRRMQSEHLNEFMMTGEIQEIAERHEQYQALMKRR